ncbi:hypothetical protein [Streptomyces lavendofoliae]|uniref:hypothetical protein n=1 Tax=Streptomyces lavendofoliae TaxID=67314 RepID=UPI003D8F8B43
MPTLARAGFSITSVLTEGEGTGLRVRQATDAVVVTWVAGSVLDPAGRQDADYEGIRAALRHALVEILTQAGHAVQVDRATGEVRVQPA